MAFEFNGSQYLETAAAVNAFPFSAAIWVMETGDVAAPGFLSSRSATNNNWELRASGTAGTNPRAYAFGVQNVLVQGGSIPRNVWTHVCGVSAAVDDHHLFINGTLVASSSTSSTLDFAALNVTRVGVRSANNSSLIGHAAEAAIWSAALTASEVASLAVAMSAEKIRPQSRVYLIPMIRNSVELQQGLSITPTGGTPAAVSHPRTYQ